MEGLFLEQQWKKQIDAKVLLFLTHVTKLRILCLSCRQQKFPDELHITEKNKKKNH